MSYFITLKNMSDEGAVMGYCVKCKEKREMQSAEEVEMKNGRKAMKGSCGTCGTGMYKILGMKK